MWYTRWWSSHVYEVKSVCIHVCAGAVSAALLPDWLTQTPACRKWHQRSPLSAHVARLSVILDTHKHTYTDKHPSCSSNWPVRRIAPCPSVHSLPGHVRFMSCPGFHFKETACCPIRSPSLLSTKDLLSQDRGLKMGRRLVLCPSFCLAEVRKGSRSPSWVAANLKQITQGCWLCLAWRSGHTDEHLLRWRGEFLLTRACPRPVCVIMQGCRP